ncbi:2-isopropylmalate synthase [hydrothermal vent metagenome]|uniref:2-isopropylmalate synthase n=1 Tax=hydrothermal vent metagenome TaxID=652676 RepID=A0A3B0ZCZ2_9ZZZZ
MKTFDHNKYRPAPSVPITNRQWPNQRIEKAPVWASVDLRDGNQALIEPMNVAQKRKMWALLLKLGLKHIEVGFPAASQADFAFVRWLIEEDQIPDDVQVQVLVQAREALIKKTFDALKGAKKAIVHVYNSTSKLQRERVFALDRDGITHIAVCGAQWVQREAAKYSQTEWQFQYSPESFSTTEMDYAVEICEAVLDVWQPTPEQPCIINLPATVEASTANLFADQVEYFCTHISRRESIIVSLHTHNDRGCAVAAAELGLMAGADRLEGTLLGNGERTGNMDMVTLAMNLYSQGIDPELDLSCPDEIIRVTTECTNIAVNPRHPWVGELVYTAFSGSHQDAIRKCLRQQRADEPWQVAYLPIDPKDIGRDYQAIIRVNSQSGKGGVAFVLERDYGLSLPRWMQTEMAELVQQVSETRGGVIDSETIYQIFMNHFVQDQTPVMLNGYSLNNEGSRDVVELRIDIEGVAQKIEGKGEGVIAAFINAWSHHSGQQINVVNYNEHATDEGSSAKAITYIQLDLEGTLVSGAALDYDTVKASLKAVISALNRDL